MSIVFKDIIYVIVQSIGIVNLYDDVVKEFVFDVEYWMCEIMQVLWCVLCFYELSEGFWCWLCFGVQKIVWGFKCGVFSWNVIFFFIVFLV